MPLVTGGQRVSLIATVRDEAASLPGWIAAIDAQARQPDEIVVVDGGSTDGTWELLQAWARHRADVRCLCLPGANIAAGRNAAIEAASGEIVAVTDAGTRARRDWLDELLRVLDDPGVDVACGFFEPALRTRWERALAATTLPDLDEVNASTFLPSSRSVAFRRTWFDGGIRYPSWLDYCEDVVFDLALRRAGARFALAGDAIVTFDVRPTPLAHARQYNRYARGDGKAGLFARRHLLRYASYGALLALLVRRRSHELGLVTILGGAYVSRPVRRLWRRDRWLELPFRESIEVLALIPLLRALGDLSKMAGYPAGLAWRWRVYRSLGRRATWRRISPDGRLWRPGSPTTESPTPTSLPGA